MGRYRAFHSWYWRSARLIHYSTTWATITALASWAYIKSYKAAKLIEFDPNAKRIARAAKKAKIKSKLVKCCFPGGRKSNEQKNRSFLESLSYSKKRLRKVLLVNADIGYFCRGTSAEWKMHENDSESIKPNVGQSLSELILFWGTCLSWIVCNSAFCNKKSGQKKPQIPK